MGFGARIKAIRDNLITYIAATSSFSSATVNYGLPRTDSTFPHAVVRIVRVDPENIISGQNLVKYAFMYAIQVVVDNTGAPTTDEDSLMDKVGEIIDALDAYTTNLGSGNGNWEELQFDGVNFGFNPATGTIAVGEATITVSVYVSF